MLRLILAARFNLHIGGGNGHRHGKEGKDQECLHGGLVFTTTSQALMVVL